MNELSKFVTVDFLVAELLGDTYDEGGVLAEKYYRWMFRIWNDINQDFIRTPRKKILPINPNLKIAALPEDLLDWEFIGYFDNCHNRLPLAVNNNLALRKGIEDDRVIKCTTCGNIDLSKTFTQDVSYETVMVGNTRTAAEITRLIHPDGSYTEERIEPTAIYNNGDFDHIENVTRKSVVCQLQVSSCGCVPASAANISMLSACGCSNDLLCICEVEGLPYPVVNDCPGSFNVYMEEGFIQFSPDTSLNGVYIEYISSGLCKGGIQYFPAIAMNALIDGAYNLSIQKKRNITETEKRRGDANYMRSLKLLNRRLTRQIMQEVLDIFNSNPRIPSYSW